MVGADPLVRGRRPGRPSHARPPILPSLRDQSGANGFLLDVAPNPLKLALVADQGLPVSEIIALARLAVIPFSDLVSLHRAYAGVTRT